MPITHQWLIPDQVVGLRWSGINTQQDLDEADQALLHILNTTHSPRIHFLSHELDLLEELPVKSYIRTQTPRHPRFGWYVVVQPRHNALARMVTQMACTLLQIRFRIVEDEATAWKCLQRVNPQIVPPDTTFSNLAS
jgi:hypothetical protein